MPDDFRRLELPYFTVSGKPGFDQDEFTDKWMKLGGCGAVTAMESCIYFDLYFGTRLCPLKLFAGEGDFLLRKDISRADYIDFSRIMKPYLRPRSRGICSTELYIRGFEEYVSMAESTFYKAAPEKGRHMSMSALSGHESFEKAEEAVRAQLSARYPIPILILDHKNPVFDDYIWHWFLITGHQRIGNYSLIKVVTYGEERWLDFSALWDTGFSEKGGMVMFELG
ncbi:MAG TPA: hypothetical protein IAB10_02160 [Candidatus Avilachnospira avistercoris]|nr:hypothetical protein [Candidatus Avilachnospira avistercoris]